MDPIKNIYNKLINFFTNRKKDTCLPDNVKETLKKHYHNERDQENNLESSPPEDENIGIKSVWIFEVYSPDYIKNLIEGIKKNNIDVIYKKLNPNRDLINIIKKRRHKSPSWVNVGTLVPPKEKKVQTIPVELPEGISSVRLKLLQYIPSITILSYQFILDDYKEKEIQKKLSKKYKTYVKKIDTVYQYVNPIHQKKEEVKKTKDEIHNKCFEWIGSNFPGMFSEINYDFPTCDFITLKKGIPFNRKSKKSHKSYISILDLDNHYNSWQCEEIPGLYLKLFSDEKGILSNAILTGNMERLFSSIDNIEGYGGKNKFGLLNYLRHIDKTLISWVFYVLLNTYKYHLAELRDNIANVNLSQVSEVAETMKGLKKDFAEFERSIPYFINEFKKHKKEDQIPFEHEMFQFSKNWDLGKEKDGDLFKELFKVLLNELSSLSNQYENVKQSLFSTANLISALVNEKISKKNMNMQKCMMIMTGIMLVLTGLMLLYNIIN